jgi:hypothetical protein
VNAKQVSFSELANQEDTNAAMQPGGPAGMTPRQL